MSWQWLLLGNVGPRWHFPPEEACLITTEHLLGNRSFSLSIFLKFCHEIISSYLGRTGSLSCLTTLWMQPLFLHLSNQLLLGLNESLSAFIPGCLSGGQYAASSTFHISVPPKCYHLLTAFCLSKATTIFLPLHLPVMLFCKHFHTLSNISALDGHFMF